MRECVWVCGCACACARARVYVKLPPHDLPVGEQVKAYRLRPLVGSCGDHITALAPQGGRLLRRVAARTAHTRVDGDDPQIRPDSAFWLVGSDRID